jgi:regulatory protein
VAVDTVDDTAERARASDLVAKRIDAAMAAGPVAARRRLLGLLSRRGYSFEVAVPVVEQALDDYSEGAGPGA